MLTLTNRDEFEILCIRAGIRTDQDLADQAQLQRKKVNQFKNGIETEPEAVLGIFGVLLPKAEERRKKGESQSVSG